VKLHNRNHIPSFRPLDRADKIPAKPLTGGGLSRDRKARIADMLRDLLGYEGIDGVMCEAIEEIIKEVEK
jgi:hypothetical protein